MQAAKKTSAEPQYFPIRIASVPIGIPLPFDIYLSISNKHVKFRKQGDVLTPDRLKNLKDHGGNQFFVPEDQRSFYVQALKNIVHDPSTSSELKSKFIKESAFLHVNDLFTKENISEVVNESHNLVEEMVSFISSDIEAVSSLLRLSVHDYYTYNHCVDVAVYSIVLARKVFGEDKKVLIAAGMGGLLHDIGKRKIDYNIINKTTKLTPEEWDEIKKHPGYGKEYLKEIPNIPEPTKCVVFEHHENFDGTGYPRGLKEDEINRLAKVVTIADVFDALTTNRSYHKAMPPSQALNTMFGMQPGKFDPTVFKSFNKNFDTKTHLKLDNDFDPCQPPPKNVIKLK
jgi:HD-GYP domain-containing protein (c-di-GMP phosphodiesterase class II)